ncbi:MAG: hypothetical protein CEE38_23515 [Planctomycetes bacterium B3_Pla]|nr:MAG: hypothetical protein CEE38_23515 [Planctomycetes bacterium B3_Pla]
MIEPRKSVQALAPYQPPLEGRRGLVRLDFNENTSGFPAMSEPLPVELLAAYPEYEEFLEHLSKSWEIPRENMMLTNGTGEALFVASFTFIEPGMDTALTSRPTFALIPHNLNLVGANLAEVPVTAGLEFDIPGIETVLNAGVKLAIFASPDNPTGAVLEPETVHKWCGQYPETLFLIDEAYAQYHEKTVMPYALQKSNLLIIRTFSKAWGMAGLRLGVVIGNPELLSYMRRVRSPYSVNCAAILTAARLLERSEEVAGAARATMERKQTFIEEVEKRGFQTHAGNANFFLLKVGLDAPALCDFCRERGVLLRDRSFMPAVEGMVRITVGTQKENKRLLECLDAFRESRAIIFDLDDTLVDTSRSYNVTVAKLIEKYSDKPLEDSELKHLRAEGGFNDEWDAALELLRRRGNDVPRDEIEREGKKIYLSLARENEKLLIDVEDLRKLAKRYRLFIATGRPRDEYEPVWAQVFDPLVETVCCKDDMPGAKPKPAPDVLLALMRNHGITGGYYVGNNVDDVQAAGGAGLTPIAVATTQDAGTLAAAGAGIVIEEPSLVRKVFML